MRAFIRLTALSLLVIVSILAFGEQARRCRYHFDGGRGWDLPQASSKDLSRPRLRHLCIGPVAVVAQPMLPDSVGLLVSLPRLSAVLHTPVSSRHLRAPPLQS